MRITKYMILAGTAMKNLFRKPNTVMFPAEHVAIPEGFRGQVLLEAKLCTVCLRCVEVCPSGALMIEEEKNNDFSFSINDARCTFCQECENACSTGAIKLSNNWLLSAGSKDGMLRKHTVHKLQEGEAPPTEVATA